MRVFCASRRQNSGFNKTAVSFAFVLLAIAVATDARSFAGDRVAASSLDFSAAVLTCNLRQDRGI